MKVWKKLQVVFLALLLCTGMMTQPALAASLLQDGIEAALTTDKETYQQGEEIKVTLTVTNTNDTAVTNLSLENILPENFVLAENAETTKKMESLQAGETVTLTTVCTVKASDDKKDDENKENPSGDDKKNPTDNEKPGNGNVANDTKNPGTTTGSKDSGTTLTKDQGTGNAKQNGQSLKAEKLKSAPKMGDNTKIIVWVVLLVLAGAAIVVALKKKNRRNKMLAWFLCLIMTGSTVAGVFPERARAEAQSVNIGKVMELSKNILVDQTTVELKAKVEYTYVKSDDPSDDTKTYTRGEWVQMLAEKVEMNLDTDLDSLNHYYADTAGNAYEAAIEIAEKYGILPPPDIEDLEQDIPFFYPDEPATREFAAYTAVHAMGFNGIHSYDTNSWTDWDSITYQNEAAIAVGKGFLELNTENQFQPHALLSKKDVKSIFCEIDEIRQEDTTIGEVLVQNSEIRYVEDIYMVERHDDFNTGSVEGTITDAVTGDGITETAYIVRKGWNNQTGDAVTEGVFENADYTLSMENGNYTLEISKEGYVTNYKNITVAGDQIETANIVLVPGDGDGETAGELRIVLTWGEEPWDLDSHLACYSSDKPYHIWFGQTDFEGNSVGNLDVDDTSSYGPETITVRNVKADEKFSYFVHDYTNSYSEVANEMSLSGAKVQVYLEGKNIATYTIPTNQPGTLWHVFDFDGATKTIKSVNTLEYQNDPYTIGGIDQEMDDVDDTEEIEMYAGKVRNKKQPEQKVVVEETPLPETTAESVISESEVEEPGEAVSKSESEPDDENVAEDETVTP